MTVDSLHHENPNETHACLATHPRLIALPAFSDNCIWALLSRDRRHCLVVDPGDPAVVQRFLASQELTLTALLITHHHADHTGGIAALRGPEVTVYGPRHEAIPGVDVCVGEGDRITPEGYGITFTVMDVPGHTRGHIAYFGCSEPAQADEPPLLFCGDTLFSAGCGRLFEGTAEQMHASLTRLAALPESTLVCCAHEYTLSNLRFAAAVEPDNPQITAVTNWAVRQRARGEFTIPGTLGRELQINPFLRTGHAAVIRSVDPQLEATQASAEIFAALRRWKDVF